MDTFFFTTCLIFAGVIKNKSDKVDTQKAWLVTGASKGFGLALVTMLLSNGNKVAAT